MTSQLKHIHESASKLKENFPKKFKPESAIILERDSLILKEIKILGEVSASEYSASEILPEHNFSIKFGKCGGRDLIVYDGRCNYFNGSSMRDIGHFIYILKFAGVKKILSVGETGHLNPRFNCGEIALIYDHINLMGDNPLIGKNENELGLRFPDMSNAYDRKLYSNIRKVLTDRRVKVNESVYVGITGPQSETDAEARFYRDIGGDVLGYSIVPENITAVHAGMDFAAIGLISRELVADRMMEDDRTEKQKMKDQKESYGRAEKELAGLIKEIVKEI